jgi:hypothetical protein
MKSANLRLVALGEGSRQLGEKLFPQYVNCRPRGGHGGPPLHLPYDLSRTPLAASAGDEPLYDVDQDIQARIRYLSL